MRRPPSAAAAASTAACTWSSSRTSQATNATPSSSASASPFSALTSAIVSAAPWARRRRAVASPSPEAPPTTSAPLPSISMARHPREATPCLRQRRAPGTLAPMARRRQRALIDRDAREAMLRSLMANVPGAIYRSAWHDDYALELISDEIERISGYPASDFLGADARRTIMSIICAEDREAVLKKAQNAVDDGQPFNLEYRIERPDGELRWVLDRGHRVKGPRGEEWMDGAIFDITERRANEEALRRHEVERARVEELRASQARIIEAADAARRRIERDLHDGAQQHLVALALEVRLARARAERDPHVGRRLPRARGRGARPGLGRAARAGPRHPSRRPHRARARPRRCRRSPGRATVPVEVLETPAGRLRAGRSRPRPTSSSPRR